jgi:hypothetical protein
MLMFEDLVKTLDPCMRVEIYITDKNGIVDKQLYNGTLKNLKIYPDAVMKIVPQSNSREVYLEIYAY